MIRLPASCKLFAAAAACVAFGAACQPVDGSSSPAGDSPNRAGIVGAAPTHAAGASSRSRQHKSAHGAAVISRHSVLPNRSRTPGVVNRAVTQANIRSTICRTGYTATIRPSSSYTTALKVDQLNTGYAYRHDHATQDYEEDHLIALEIGGAPDDARNLWPEPYAASTGARVKDLVENQLHDLVCAGQVPLRTAQRAMAVNWWRAYQRYGGRGVPVVFVGSFRGSKSAPTAVSGSSSSSGASARCVDGTLSYSQHRSGTCSHHGGVATWIHEPAS